MLHKQLVLGVVITLLFPWAQADVDCQPMFDRYERMEHKIKTGQTKPVEVRGDTLILTGMINPRMKNDFEKIPASTKKKLKKLVINSPGGIVADAEPIAQFVENRFGMGSGRKLYVPSEGICASACTTIYHKAWTREADESAIFLYHPASPKKNMPGNLTKKLFLKMGASLVTYSKEVERIQRDKDPGIKKISQRVLKGEEFCLSAEEAKKASVVHDLSNVHKDSLLGPDQGPQGVQTIGQ